MKLHRSTAIFCIVTLLTFSLLSAQSADSRSQSFKVGGKGTLDISVDSSDITIRVGSGSQVQVEARGLVDPDQNLRMTQEGDTIRIEYRRQGRNRRWGFSRGSRFDVTIPSSFNVEFGTSGGDIRIDGDLSGYVSGRTSGGDIEVGDIGGDADLKTSGGDITTGFLQGRAEIKTSGGDIQIAQAAESLDVGTSGGDLELGDIGGALSARTSGGSIEVRNVGADAEMTTAGGDIKARIVSGSAKMKTAGGDLELESAFGHIEAVTAGGSIRLDEVTGSVEARTAGGDIEVTLIPDGEGQSSLKSAGGDLILNLPASARVTIEALIRETKDRGWGRRGNREYEIRSAFQAVSYDRDEDKGEIYAVYQVNGGGPLIKMETASGNIDIRQSAK